MAYTTRFSVYGRNTFVLSVQFLIFSFCFINAQWVIDDAGCTTPDGKVGNCIEILDCEPMTTILKESANVISHIAPILNNYRCGVIDKKVKVCCPSDPITLNGLGLNIRIGETSTIESTIPDVSGHKNLHLLPTDYCGPVPTGDRLVGGRTTVLFEFPWMALLSYQSDAGVMHFRCAGSIINDRYILTAAHCLSNLRENTLIGVRCGEYNISSVNDCEQDTLTTEVCAPPVQDMKIEKVIAHANYSTVKFTDDIGLIRLAAPLNMTVESVKPICLPLGESNRNYKYSDTEKLIVSGWGATESGRSSPTLLKLNVPVVTNLVCESTLKQIDSQLSITEKQLCAGGVLGEDSCGGDSGGPLQTLGVFQDQQRFVQHGIVSFGPKYCGNTRVSAVYTKVQSYMDWILDNMEP